MPPRRVADLPPDLRADLDGHDVVVFDGVCVLCSGLLRFVLRHDRAERFRFVRAQSDLGARLYEALGMPTEEFETNLVIVGGRIHTHLDAFGAAMRALGWPLKALGAASWIPGPIAKPIYFAIARNRYRLFGRTDTCMMPTPELRARFLDAM